MSRRDRQPELMDDPDLEPGRHRHALAGLARLNRVSGSGRLVWSALRDLAVQGGAEPLRILDLATGGGDVPLALVRCAPRWKYSATAWPASRYATRLSLASSTGIRSLPLFSLSPPPQATENHRLHPRRVAGIFVPTEALVGLRSL